MPTYEFTAVEVGIEENEDCLVATLDSGNDRYVMLQRHKDIGSINDGGVYVEIEDQINAATGIIEHCALSISRFELKLTKPLQGFTTILATTTSSPTEYKEFISILRRIFTGFESILTIET